MIASRDRESGVKDQHHRKENTVPLGHVEVVRTVTRQQAQALTKTLEDMALRVPQTEPGDPPIEHVEVTIKYDHEVQVDPGPA